MRPTNVTIKQLISSVSLSAMAFSLAGAAIAQSSPIVQPGAPGGAAKELSADEAIAIAKNSFSPDDVNFMRDMITHHQQAVDMAALVADRTNRKEIIDLAGRIDASQADEIAFMRGWLSARGQAAKADDAMHRAHKMKGMATPEQMASLADVKSTEFDQLFLKLMTAHHGGALTMVKNLLEQPGSVYDPVLFEFTNDVVTDQKAEIERMNALSASISTDPRAGLSPGFDDAGEAIMKLELVASLA